MADRLAVDRRDLFKLLGVGVLFQFVSAADGRPLSTRLHVAPGGGVTLLTGKVEIGQGCRTLLTQCVAEEMRIDPSRVKVVMGDTALVPDDGGTYGSLTTPTTVPIVRQAAAAARRMLATMKPDQAMLAEIPLSVDVTPPADWKVLGRTLAHVNGRAIVTGALKFAGDLRAPEMLAGKVVRADAYLADLVSFDGSKAEQLPGVKIVRDGNFLGVIASDDATAQRAAALVKAEWRRKELVQPPALFEHLKKTSTEPVENPNTRYPPLLRKGSVEEGLRQAALRHQATYTLPNIAHTPIEPRVAVAEWDSSGLTVHCGTQVPFAARQSLSRTFGIEEKKVRVISSDTGTGFGGKHGPEVMIEAARLAKAAGKPVRVAWTREEEFTCSYCRPAAIVEVRSGLTGDGKIVAWDFHNYNSGPASLPAPYAIPNYWCGFHRAESPLRQGPYRSLAAVANTFARETHVEELAALAGEDSVEFRLRNLENPRMREVIERAAERFGWKGHKGTAGMACNLEKDAHMALFAEVDVKGAKVRVVRMTMAFDCGAVLNPDYLKNQITGALIMGMGGALFEELRYDRFKIVNASLSEYRVPRFRDVPAIEVILVDRREVTPAGAGESPITVVAPALGAAIHAATGKRLRALPFEKAMA